MKTVVILIALVLFAVPVFADTYEWEDSQGTVNFADDLGKVPKQYRKKVKIVGEEEPLPQEETEGKEPPAAERKGQAGKGEAQKGAAANEARGGKDKPAPQRRTGEEKSEAPQENKNNVPAAK